MKRVKPAYTVVICIFTPNIFLSHNPQFAYSREPWLEEIERKIMVYTLMVTLYDTKHVYSIAVAI